MPALALKLFKDTPLADFGADRDDVVIQAIILEFKAGHLEQAVAHLNDLDEDIKKLNAREPRGNRTLIFHALQVIRARLEGNTQAVIESLNQVNLGTIDPAYKRIVLEVPLLPLAARLPADPDGKSYVVASLACTGGAAIAMLEIWMQTRELLINEMMYHYDRAMLDLLDGNPNGARAASRWPRSRRAST